MTQPLLTLEQWATARYGTNAPHINTLYRWAKAGCIYPKPRKHGRAYMVAADAVYLDPMDAENTAQALEERHGFTSAV